MKPSKVKSVPIKPATHSEGAKSKSGDTIRSTPELLGKRIQPPTPFDVKSAMAAESKPKNARVETPTKVSETATGPASAVTAPAQAKPVSTQVASILSTQSKIASIIQSVNKTVAARAQSVSAAPSVGPFKAAGGSATAGASGKGAGTQKLPTTQSASKPTKTASETEFRLIAPSDFLEQKAAIAAQATHKKAAQASEYLASETKGFYLPMMIKDAYLVRKLCRQAGLHIGALELKRIIEREGTSDDAEEEGAESDVKESDNVDHDGKEKKFSVDARVNTIADALFVALELSKPYPIDQLTTRTYALASELNALAPVPFDGIDLNNLRSSIEADTNSIVEAGRELIASLSDAAKPLTLEGRLAVELIREHLTRVLATKFKRVFDPMLKRENAYNYFEQYLISLKTRCSTIDNMVEFGRQQRKRVQADLTRYKQQLTKIKAALMEEQQKKQQQQRQQQQQRGKKGDGRAPTEKKVDTSVSQDSQDGSLLAELEGLNWGNEPVILGSMDVEVPELSDEEYSEEFGDFDEDNENEEDVDFGEEDFDDADFGDEDEDEDFDHEQEDDEIDVFGKSPNNPYSAEVSSVAQSSLLRGADPIFESYSSQSVRELFEDPKFTAHRKETVTDDQIDACSSYLAMETESTFQRLKAVLHVAINPADPEALRKYQIQKLYGDDDETVVRLKEKVRLLKEAIAAMGSLTSSAPRELRARHKILQLKLKKAMDRAAKAEAEMIRERRNLAKASKTAAVKAVAATFKRAHETLENEAAKFESSMISLLMNLYLNPAQNGTTPFDIEAEEIWHTVPHSDEFLLSSNARGLLNRRVRLTVPAIPHAPPLELNVLHFVKLFWLFETTQKAFAPQRVKEVNSEDTNFPLITPYYLDQLLSKIGLARSTDGSQNVITFSRGNRMTITEAQALVSTLNHLPDGSVVRALITDQLRGGGNLLEGKSMISIQTLQNVVALAESQVRQPAAQKPKKGGTSIRSNDDDEDIELMRLKRQLLYKAGKSAVLLSERDRQVALSLKALPQQFLKCVYSLMLRYRCLQGSNNRGGGNQAAIPPQCFAVMTREFGVTAECFASPFNCYYSQYCSAFADTDAFFGSLGSFFNFTPLSGSFELNPPFDHRTILASAVHCEALLYAAAFRFKDDTESVMGDALSFIVVIPQVVTQPGWRHFNSSPFKTGQINLKRREHYFTTGLQQLRKPHQMLRAARHDTTVFILQTPAAAKKWPVTLAKLEKLKKAFMP